MTRDEIKSAIMDERQKENSGFRMTPSLKDMLTDQVCLEMKRKRVAEALDEIYSEDKVEYLKALTKLIDKVIPKGQEISFNADNIIDIEATIAVLKETLKSDK